MDNGERKKDEIGEKADKRHVGVAGYRGFSHFALLSSESSISMNIFSRRDSETQRKITNGLSS